MKLLYVTNIPAPYRNKRFNTMQEIFPELGIEFEVLYMAWKEPNRFWELDLNDFKYKYKVYKGIHPVIGKMFAHFNPGLFLRLLKADYDAVIIGGMGSPSHWIAPFFVSPKKLKILSVETNLHSTSRKKGLALKFKNFLTKQYNAYQITGESSKQYINWLHEESKNLPFITLPNLVDENVFSLKVNEARKEKDLIRKSFGLNEKTQLWICPARLEKIKGLHTFIPLIKGIKNIKLFIIGEGSLKEELTSIIQKENLPVELLGFKQQGDMVKLYAAADLFVLPSLSDPSPLSPIEAIAAGLPVLVSERIGNFNDVLQIKKNGWGFDPAGDPEVIKNLLNLIAGIPIPQLTEMGRVSYQQYNLKFENRTCIKAFGMRLLDLMKDKKNNH